MDINDEDLLRLWEFLAKRTVRYIMVGGFATRFHGFNRNTQDIDIWLDDNIDNRRKLNQVFTDLEYGALPNIETMQFLPGFTSVNLGGIELDIMTDMKGLNDLSFDECLSMASIADLDGIQVPFLHINQLIANKKAVNRAKDQIDVIELEKIKKLREQNKSY